MVQWWRNVKIKNKSTSKQNSQNPIIGFLFKDRLGQELFGENTLAIKKGKPMLTDANTLIEAYFDFRLPMLPNGDYEIAASIGSGTYEDHVQHHWMHDALIVKVSSSKVRYGLVG